MNELISLPATQLPTLSFTEQAIRIRDDALADSALIGKVDTSEENDAATVAHTRLNDVLRAVEKARKEVKQPIIELGRAIDARAKEFVSELQEESNRVGQLTADYHALQEAKRRAAEAAARAEQQRIERERIKAEREAAEEIERKRQEALAAAKDHDELDRINEEAAEAQRIESERLRAEAEQRAADAAAIVPKQEKADGQIVRHTWDFTITDIWTLARAHPTCVTITPRRGEIMDLLNAGVKVAGIDAKQVVKTSTRTQRNAFVEV